MRALATSVMLVALAVPAMAQSVVKPATGTGTSTASDFSGMTGPASVKKLLVDGYEIKTGFSDNSGGAYMILQKAASAYMCHSNPTPACEKLN